MIGLFFIGMVVTVLFFMLLLHVMEKEGQSLDDEKRL
tara:strand:+ start:23094 stop:23204 length:111 start_codon:yes stop_codon:yes gene_type:complete